MRRLRFASPWLLPLGAAAGLLLPGHAAAGWPPPEQATAEDMANPTYWPNDEDYAYSDERDGQWNYYSFVPTPSGGAMPRREETASGMSIDLAWRLTIGDPSVKIVITDSGIAWDSADLLEKAWINHGELGNHKPLLASGDPCGGEGALAGFDCNGDGVLTVSDYKDTPSLQPEAAEGRPKGDKNANGKLDAGDLILNFSDGLDDDQNGYVDDISGWDFFKNDNDPYDDTRYGHGTGEARDSTAQANNGIGTAGACPLCRFVPARVGDSFITDVSDFAKAVVYATDNGAKVVQCALGTIDNNRFTQAALDYAYENGVLVVTSMADESSRHHNMPATSNHTLPVHAIQFDGPSVTSSTTFVDYHPCSNFGGQNFLSASGTGCSSEATGQLSGIAGLLYAAAIAYDETISPGEAQNLFFMTADDVDVAESREPEPPYAWSQPGFDQRFGYGRVNANRAIEAIRDKRIPPSVDITSPRWFQVLYQDQVQGAIPLEGTISAKRATSYDYYVEWASGVQPLEGEFEVLWEEKNVAPTIVIGSDGPIYLLDIRTLDPAHERDSDSPLGENDATITVRVRAVAHYGGEIGDVPGEMRRTYYVYEDPSLVKGFPVWVGDSGEGSPKMADLDGDGVRELVYPTSGGALHALRMTPDGPKPLDGFPFRTNLADGFTDPPPTPQTPVYLSAPAYASGAVDVDLAREAIVSTPAIADLDGDGAPEIVVSTWPGTIYVVGADGALAGGWPVRLPEVPSCPLDPGAPPATSPCMSTESRIARGTFASPVLVDLDGDGALEVVQAAFDGKVYAFDAGGAIVDGWPVEVHYTLDLAGEEPDRNRILTTPAVGDFNDDGVPDLLVGSNEQLGDEGQAGAIYLLDGRGTNAPGGPVLPGWPISTASLQLFPLVAEGVGSSGVVGRFGGELAAVAHGNGSVPLVLPEDPGAQATLAGTPANALPLRADGDRGLAPGSAFGPRSKAKANTMFPLFAQPSLGDLDQDGVPDVVASGGSLTLALTLQGQAAGASSAESHLMAAWSGKTGAMLPGSPFILEDYTFFNSQAIADVTGDDYPEILTGSGGYFLHAIDACGREARGFPKFTGQWIISTPALGDIDGDGGLEVAVGTRSGWLYAWHTEATEGSIIAWEGFHHDNRNTGNLETPLDQGAQRRAAAPLTEGMCSVEAAVADPLRAAGGCACRAPGGGEGGAARRGAALAALAALAAIARRRRARSA